MTDKQRDAAANWGGAIEGAVPHHASSIATSRGASGRLDTRY